MIVVIITFLVSLLVSLSLIPVLSRGARRTGLVDHPDDKRKLHTSAIPLVGGLGVFLTVVVVAPLAILIGISYQSFFIDASVKLLGWIPVDFSRRVITLRPDDARELGGLVLASSVLVIVGLLDDRFGIRGRQKLMGQFIATTILIIFGYHFEKVTMGEWTVNFDVFSVLFVYAWVIAATNSVNLLDGADGIAATIGIIMSISLCLMAIFLGQMANAIVVIAFAGALVGFLKFNFPPAKVYLGDTGSMLIGFVLSALSIRCTFKQNSAFAFFAPLALLAIPFIDTTAAIIRRRLTGRSIFAVDRGHLHHSLMKHGYSPKISLLWVALLCTTTAAGGVLTLVTRQSEYAFASIAIVIAVMLACRFFGVAEFRLVSQKANGLARSMLEFGGNRADTRQSMIHVQGSRDWQAVWERLALFAEEHRLLELTMDLNAPWMHESFHATHERKDMPRGGNHEWFVELPLIADNRLFGRVQITGSGQEDLSHHEIVERVLKVTRTVEESLLAEETQSRQLDSGALPQNGSANRAAAQDDSGAEIESSLG